MDTLQKIAVLIDADNAQLSKIEAVMREVSAYGRIVVRKAFGNWQKTNLKNWENELKRLAIKAEQQFDYVGGKNATDISMVIAALDLLYTGIYDAFVLVASDSDYTPLAIRLRESGVYVIGVGVSTTVDAFKKACDEFILVENLSSGNEEPIAAEPATPGATQNEKSVSKENPGLVTENSSPSIEEIHNLLEIASDKYQDADGFVNISAAGVYIKRTKPDFDARTYGYAKINDLLKAFPDRYTMKKYKGKGTAMIVAYKCLSKKSTDGKPVTNKVPGAKAPGSKTPGGRAPGGKSTGGKGA